MSHTSLAARLNNPTLACALMVLVIPWSLSRAATQIEEHRAASPQGSVDIVNVAGSIDVQGWDKSEVEVTGSAGKEVERVEVTGDANRTTVRVILHNHGSWGSGGDGEARLLIHVPAGSSITTSLVSANLKVSGVKGDAKLQTVSGNISGDVGGDLRANNVSGNVVLTAAGAKSIEVKTVNGNITLIGGDADLEVTTVNGDARITLKTAGRARFESVSGTVSANFALGADAKIDGESVSGDIKLELAGVPSGDFDLQTLSGNIDNCFGPKPVKAQYGPGTRLTFKSGDGHARVRVQSQSGNVRMCAKS
jgi:DUF4097 and DUF4098 domain-containing protein YvlB